MKRTQIDLSIKEKKMQTIHDTPVTIADVLSCMYICLAVPLMVATGFFIYCWYSCLTIVLLVFGRFVDQLLQRDHRSVLESDTEPQTTHDEQGEWVNVGMRCTGKCFELQEKPWTEKSIYHSF